MWLYVIFMSRKSPLSCNVRAILDDTQLYSRRSFNNANFQWQHTSTSVHADTAIRLHVELKISVRRTGHTDMSVRLKGRPIFHIL